MIFSCPAKEFPPPVKPWWGLFNFAYGSESGFGQIEIPIIGVQDAFTRNDLEFIDPVSPASDYERWQNEAALPLLNEPFQKNMWGEGPAYETFGPILDPSFGGTQDGILWNLTFDFDAVMNSYPIEPDDDGMYRFLLYYDDMVGEDFLANVIPVVCSADPFAPWFTGRIDSVEPDSRRIEIRIPAPFSN